MTGFVKIGDPEDWRVDHATYGGPYIRTPGDRYEIARVAYRRGADGRDVNFEETHRICLKLAAAPAMLAALQAFVAHYPHGINPYLDEAYSAARVAIDRATSPVRGSLSAATERAPADHQTRVPANRGAAP